MISSSLVRRMVCTFAVCAAACLTVTAQTIRSPELQQSATGRAFQKLLHAHVFNFGGVGWGQAITEEEKAFKVIFESLDAERLFMRLAHEANAEGQLYGLFGLRARGSLSFAAEAQRLQNDEGPPERTEEMMFIPKGKVRVAHGCLFFDQEMEKAVDGIVKGRWDALFSSHQPQLMQLPN